MRLVKVKLIGELGRKFGRCYEFMAASPKDVMSALCNQLAGFKEYMTTAHERGIGFRVVNHNPEGMDYENLMMPCDNLIVAPIVTGGGAIGRILIGVALIALAFVSFGSSVAFAGIASAGAKAAIGSSLLFSLGTTLVLTGIAQLLTPQQSNSMGDTERKESFLFDRASDLTNQGLPVPILYGRYLAASPLIVSSAITTQQVPV